MGRTVCIVQARMGSTRLPGKVLKPLGGRTALSHVLERAAAIPGIDLVCCATSHRPEDRAVAEEADRCGVEVSIGSETDVLDRYYRAAKTYDAEVVMRLTGDCPLNDPWVSGEVLDLFRRDNGDYAANNLEPTWPHGVDAEVFGFKWLERAAREATSPDYREHVSTFIRYNPSARKLNLTSPEPAPEHRWALDTEADYLFLSKLFEVLPEGSESWNHREVISVLDAHPELRAESVSGERKEGVVDTRFVKF